MENLRTDSPLSRRIVLSFLDFLNSVEPAPGIDSEGLEVVRECLEEVFKISHSSSDDQRRPNLLVELFSSPNVERQHEARPDLCCPAMPVEAPSTTSTQNVGSSNLSEPLKSQNEESSGEAHLSGILQDELFGQFCGALEKIHFFKPTAAGDDDHLQLDKAKQFFDAAILEMEKSGCQTHNVNNLAEALKTQGNEAMKSMLYSDAVDLYTCAISLCGHNAVYYCNRAAAYTQLQKYSEAIEDCYRSIEINPNYSKAYSRLGFVYYEQGKYSDAISEGFLKALQLDPTSTSIRENIRAAEQKLREELLRSDRDQNAGPSHSEEPNNHSGARTNQGASPFTSMPFGASLPPDLANMFMNMAANTYPGSQQNQGHPRSSNSNGSNDPEVTIAGNINMTFGEGDGVNVTIGQELPDIVGAWRSVMDMFPSQGQQGDRHA